MNIFVTRTLPASVIAKLESAGSVEVYAGDGPITADELRARVAGKHALVTMLTEQVDAGLLDAGKDLKVVANVAVGYNNIDVPAARARGVIVTNTPDVLTDSVADFTWSLILAITRRLSEGERVVRRGEWKGWAFDYMLGTELRGKQLGLIGLGRIAKAVAARASVFGVRVAYASRSDSAIEGAERMSLDQLLNTSDIVYSVRQLRARGCEFLHVPATYYEQLKSKLASGYHRDFQLLKEPVMRGVDRLEGMLSMMAVAVPRLLVDRDKCLGNLSGGLALADQLSDRPLLLTEPVRGHDHRCDISGSRLLDDHRDRLALLRCHPRGVEHGPATAPRPYPRPRQGPRAPSAGSCPSQGTPGTSGGPDRRP